MTTPTRYRNARVGGCLHADVRRRAVGIAELTSSEPLGAHPATMNHHLARWAAEAPERTFVARRGAGASQGERGGGEGGEWIRITYAQMLDRARRIGQALLDRGLDAERPVVILSDNDLEHLSLALGAMWAGIPHAPISPAYSLLSSDHAKLKHIVATLTPGLVFASGVAYAKAIAAAVPADVEVVMTEGVAPSQRPCTPFADLLATSPRAALQTAHAAITPDTIVKFLFTSGSTKQPKGVINTHRMWCANQQMLAQTLAFLQNEPPVLVDWLPWNHTFGGNHNVGITLANGGTLYIDDGRPTPAGMATTLRNLREIAPTVYFNVPKGFEELAAAMEADDALARMLFSRVQAFMFAGAGLSQAVWDRLDTLGERTVGERIPVFTGLGMTECAPTCTFAVNAAEVRSGHIGLPVPGVTAKLVPVEGKTEIRFRGPNVMPGYWREPALTREAFDDEGFYRTGDAVAWIDDADPQRGLKFDGRIAEDFKLATGTFVSVGPMRARVIAEGAPYVQDVVITGLNRDEVGAMVFARLDDCRRLAGDNVPADAQAVDVLRSAPVRAFFQSLLDRLWAAGTGSASRVAWLTLLAEPPAIDRGELTDKGSINQRAVLTHRAARVAALHDGTDPDALRPTISRG